MPYDFKLLNFTYFLFGMGPIFILRPFIPSLHNCVLIVSTPPAKILAAPLSLLSALSFLLLISLLNESSRPSGQTVDRSQSPQSLTARHKAPATPREIYQRLRLIPELDVLLLTGDEETVARRRNVAGARWRAQWVQNLIEWQNNYDKIPQRTVTPRIPTLFHDPWPWM